MGSGEGNVDHAILRSKLVIMSRLLESFIEGYGSVVQLLLPEQTEQEDFENISGDWIQVGSYLRDSIRAIEMEVGEGAEEGTAGQAREEG